MDRTPPRHLEDSFKRLTSHLQDKNPSLLKDLKEIKEACCEMDSDIRKLKKKNEENKQTTEKQKQGVQRRKLICPPQKLDHKQIIRPLICPPQKLDHKQIIRPLICPPQKLDHEQRNAPVLVKEKKPNPLNLPWNQPQRPKVSLKALHPQHNAQKPQLKPLKRLHIQKIHPADWSVQTTYSRDTKNTTTGSSQWSTINGETSSYTSETQHDTWTFYDRPDSP